jgi:hypothetical protein
MLIPSSFALFAGVLSIVGLAAADWYVWGLNLATNPRQPRRPQLLTGLELVDMGLARVVAANQAVLPKAVLGMARANGAPVADPDDGFKRVA